MTRPITFQDAQQAVAEKYGFPNFSDLVILGPYSPTRYYGEASELMARSWANYYVESDRATIRSTCLDSMPKQDRSGEVEGYYWIFNGAAFQELPLPFPEEI